MARKKPEKPARSKLDPRLRFLQQMAADEVFAAGGAEEVAVLGARATEHDAAPSEANVLLSGDRAALLAAVADAGGTVRSVTEGNPTIVSASVPLSGLDSLTAEAGVLRIEAGRQLVPDLDLSRDDVRAGLAHALPPLPGVRGAGTFVGVIDSGIDYAHPAFRRPDGSSRVAFLWDQNAAPLPNGPVPYGRQYTAAELDAALAAPNPLAVVPHRDRDGHGTHVAGIAAANGRAGVAFTGIAPDADLLVVATRSDAGTLGRSDSAVDALNFLVDRASGRPLAVNMSLGMNGGGHSGETLLERAIDSHCRRPNFVFVKSAGNEQQQRIHAGGTLTTGQTVELEFTVEANDRDPDVIEVWFAGEDALAVSVRPPGAAATAEATPQNRSVSEVTPSGNEVALEYDDDDGGDRVVTLMLSRKTAPMIQPGTWRVVLRGATVKAGRYDAWIERAARGPFALGEQAKFRPASADDSRTISIPGTARRAITVGSYVTRALSGTPVGQISGFSSRGPTRLGVMKPEVTAPGEWVVSTRSSQSGRPADPDFLHTTMPGTSQAAPHVTGVAALVLGVAPGLTCDQVKQILMRTARRDGPSSSAPDDTWGAGRVDALAAVELARTAVFPVVLSVTVTGSTVQVVTSVPTTAAVRVSPFARRLELGEASASRVSLVMGTSHTISLAGLPAGQYFAEVLAFSQTNFTVADDHNGQFYAVTV